MSSSIVSPRLVCVHCQAILSPAFESGRLYELGRGGGLRCAESVCGAWTFAVLFRRGDVRPQLRRILGPERAETALRAWRLPHCVPTSRYWLMAVPSSLVDLMREPQQLIDALLVSATPTRKAAS